MSGIAFENFIDAVYGKGETYSTFVHAGDIEEMFTISGGVDDLEEEKLEEDSDKKNNYEYKEENDKEDAEHEEHEEEEKKDDDKENNYQRGSGELSVGSLSIKIGLGDSNPISEFTGGVTIEDIKFALTH